MKIKLSWTYGAIASILILACIIASCLWTETISEVRQPQNNKKRAIVIKQKPETKKKTDQKLPDSAKASQKTGKHASDKIKSANSVGPYSYQKTISPPFSRYEERYRPLFYALDKGGMQPARIDAIFSSKRAKKIDPAPVKKMSEKVFSSPSRRTKKQISGIAKNISKHLDKYKKEYDKIVQNFGVNREIAASILFKETHLGEFNNWKHDSFTVLNNILSFMDIPPEYDERKQKRLKRIIATARDSLQGLLLYCDKYEIDILNTKFNSSFAGAIGIPQFLPMYMDYAISDTNSRPDISKMPDAILSLGNLLKTKFNWPGYMELNRLENINTIRNQYIAFDKRKNVSLCMASDLDGYPLKPFSSAYSDIPEIDYICQYTKALMNYNYSSYYALDVLLFAYHTHKLRPVQERPSAQIEPSMKINSLQVQQTSTPETVSRGNWYVILYSYPKANRREAEAQVSVLRRSKYKAFLIDGNNHIQLKNNSWMVVLGPYVKKDARNKKDEVRSEISDADPQVAHLCDFCF